MESETLLTFPIFYSIKSNIFRYAWKEGAFIGVREFLDLVLKLLQEIPDKVDVAIQFFGNKLGCVVIT